MPGIFLHIPPRIHGTIRLHVPLRRCCIYHVQHRLLRCVVRYYLIRCPTTHYGSLFALSRFSLTHFPLLTRCKSQIRYYSHTRYSSRLSPRPPCRGRCSPANPLFLNYLPSRTRYSPHTRHFSHTRFQSHFPQRITHFFFVIFFCCDFAQITRLFCPYPVVGTC